MSTMQRVPKFVAVIAAFAVLVIASKSVEAQETRLTAAEIKSTISGNSIKGEWQGASYKQYFDPDGTTVYSWLGSKPAVRGKWRIDEVKDLYCSKFPSWGNACYEIYLDGDTLIYIAPGNRLRLSAELLSGKHLY